ncbi:MAG: ABC transporter permease [Anaerolineales bacterium]|jgi:ABC-type dipeptide/oligopeptide/nickel transport system permease subunit
MLRSLYTENVNQVFRVILSRGIIVKISLAIILMFVFAALFAPILTPYTPFEQDLTLLFAKPSAEHLLGTDNIGRDLLTRLLYGARISLTTSLLASIWGGLIGITLGLIAGYFEGFISSIIMRIIDAQLSIPSLILSMVLAMVVGKSILEISIVIGIGAIPAYTRMVYGMVLSLKNNDYVIAAALIGQSDAKILIKHLLPNCFAPLIVIFTMSLGIAIMVEAGLAYLGVGITPPTPAWGVMVSEGYDYLVLHPRLAILPGLCVMLVVVAFNIVGDGLRDALDPRLRGKL